MIEYFNLSPKSVGNRQIPKSDLSSRIRDVEKRKMFDKLVKNVVWLAIIRPAETGIPAFENIKYKYEEIQILEVELNSYTEYDEFYYITSLINKCIPYPLIILIKYHEKYRIIMNLIRKNLKNRSLFKIEEILITFWVYPKFPSLVSKKIMEQLNIPKYQSKNNFELYTEMYNNIKLYSRKCLQETTLYFFFSHFLNMNESDIEDEIEYIESNYIGEKYKPPVSKSKIDIYCPQDERHTIPKYQYDYEDIWHAFQQRIKIDHYLKAHNINSMIKLMDIIAEKKKSIYESTRFDFYNLDKLGNAYVNDILFGDEESDNVFSTEATSEPDVDDLDSADYSKLIDHYGGDDD
jgi:hypothetical protein